MGRGCGQLQVLSMAPEGGQQGNGVAGYTLPATPVSLEANSPLEVLSHGLPAGPLSLPGETQSRETI